MTEESLNQHIAGFAVGIALLVAGGIGLLLHKKNRWLRLVIVTSVAGASGTVSAFCVPEEYAMASTAIAIASIAAVAGAINLTPALRFLTHSRIRPAGQSLMLIASGVIAVAGSITLLAIDEQKSEADDCAWMIESTHRPELQIVADLTVATDRDRTIALREPVAPRNVKEIDEQESRLFADRQQTKRLIRLGPPSDVSNCHGWVFTGGRYWIGPEDVEKILVDNGYEQISDPRPGDVVIYFLHAQISHTALVHSALPNRPVMAEGKWGRR